MAIPDGRLLAARRAGEAHAMALTVDRKDLNRAVKGAAASADPLDRLVAALEVQAELEALGTEVVARYVGKARAAGCAWSKIGDALGVTKQAVQQRFAGRSERVASSPRAVAGGRSAVAAVLLQAAEEAKRVGRRQVEPQHVAAALLPGVADAACLGSMALARLVVDADGVRDALVGAPRSARPVTARTTRSAGVGAAIVRADRLASSRGARRADTGDLLEALVEVVEGLADGRIGAAPDAVRDEVARLRRYGFADA